MSMRRDVGAMGMFWDGDHNESIHMTSVCYLDHDINGDELLTALKETLKLYPLLNCAFVGENGRQVLVQSDYPLEIFNEERNVAPLTKRSGERCFTLNYRKNEIAITGIHSLFDGLGHTMLFRGIVWRYCKIHFGKDFKIDGIKIDNEAAHGDYLADKMDIDLGEMNVLPFVSVPNDAFNPPLFAPDKDGNFYLSALQAPADEFLKACRSIGASPSVMLFIVFARAVVSRYASENVRVTSMLTADLRPALDELKESIFGNSAALYLTVTSDELKNEPAKNLAVKLREELNRQRSTEYTKSLVKLMQTGELGGYNITGINTYVGHVDFGECDEHITDCFDYNCSAQTINMIEYKGNFNIFISMGMATEDFTAAVGEELKKLGVTTSVRRKTAVIPTEITD